MLSCTAALIIYAFIDLIFNFQSDVMAYICLSGLAGYSAKQGTKEYATNRKFSSKGVSPKGDIPKMGEEGDVVYRP